MPVEVSVDRGVVGDQLRGGRGRTSLRGHGVLGEGGSKGDGIVPVLHVGLETGEELVTILVDHVTSVGGDEDVAVPAVGGGAAGVLGDHFLHEGLVPVDVALGVAHVEGVHELEAHVLGGGESIVDSIDGPALIAGAVGRNPVEREAVNANVLGCGHVGLPLVLVVGVGVLQHEVGEDGCGGRSPERNRGKEGEEKRKHRGCSDCRRVVWSVRTGIGICILSAAGAAGGRMRPMLADGCRYKKATELNERDGAGPRNGRSQ